MSNDEDESKSVIKGEAGKYDVLVYPPTTTLFGDWMAEYENILKIFLKK